MKGEKQRHGRFKLARQSGGIGLYADVTVLVSEIGQGPEIEFSGSEFAWLKDVYGPDAFEWACCHEFRRGAVAGASYAVEHLSDSLDGNRLRVVIEKIHAAPADTNERCVAYATCFAIWNALGLEGTQKPEIRGREIYFPN